MALGLPERLRSLSEATMVAARLLFARLRFMTVMGSLGLVSRE